MIEFSKTSLGGFGLPDPAVSALHASGIVSAEQLLALTSIPVVNALTASMLGLSVRDLRALASRIATALSSDVRIAARQRPPRRGFGSLEPNDEIRREIEAEARDLDGPASLPDRVDLSAQMPPPRDQGFRGTCVAFALSAVHEHARRIHGQTFDFSEQFLYREAKKIDFVPSLCGTWMMRAAQVLDRRGQCLEETWPYVPFGACNGHGALPKPARPEATRYRMEPVIIANRNLLRAKTVLASGRTVGCSIPTYRSWTSSMVVWVTGEITLPLSGESMDQGHAICLIGYVDDASIPGGGYFIIRNSWGETWGQRSAYGAGNGTLPYAYVQNHCFELVTLYDA
jgi:C1A family cysteine protease